MAIVLVVGAVVAREIAAPRIAIARTVNLPLFKWIRSLPAVAASLSSTSCYPGFYRLAYSCREEEGAPRAATAANSLREWMDRVYFANKPGQLASSSSSS